MVTAFHFFISAAGGGAGAVEEGTRISTDVEGGGGGRAKGGGGVGSDGEGAFEEPEAGRRERRETNAIARAGSLGRRSRGLSARASPRARAGAPRSAGRGGTSDLGQKNIAPLRGEARTDFLLDGAAARHVAAGHPHRGLRRPASDVQEGGASGHSAERVRCNGTSRSDARGSCPVDGWWTRIHRVDGCSAAMETR